MIDGFWIVQFEAVQGRGGGVAILTKGQIFGGDSGFTYTGKYETDERTLKARVTVRNFLPDVPSIFGITGDYDLNLNADVHGDVINGKAIVVGQSGAGIVVRLTKRGDLP
jgi:hypothetical protein